MGLQCPEAAIAVEVGQRLLDRPALGRSRSRSVELVDRLRGEVLERDPVGLGLGSDRGRRQVDGDEMRPARLQQPLDLAAAGNVGVECDLVTLGHRALRPKAVPQFVPSAGEVCERV
jgi:hypothetical protein